MIYTINEYSFEILNKNYLKKILLIRNRKKVREASFDTKIIQEKEHTKWFNSKIRKPFFNHYVLIYKKKVVGVGYGEKFSEENKSCLYGFYSDLSIKKKEIKYGSIIKYLIIEKLFENKNIIQVECQVKKGFEWIKDWHIRWGHELINFDNKLNSYNLVLKKSKWNNIKTKIYEEVFKKS